jgi:2-aminoadipate transaminase
MRTLTASGVLVSGGNFNHFTSHIVRQLMESGELPPFVAQLRASYAARAEAMDLALRKHLSGVARWTKPAGGYFFWLELAAGVDAGTLQDAARAAGTGFLAGAACCTSGGLKNCLRLSFAHYSVPDIREGVAR